MVSRHCPCQNGTKVFLTHSPHHPSLTSVLIVSMPGNAVYTHAARNTPSDRQSPSESFLPQKAEPVSPAFAQTAYEMRFPAVPLQTGMLLALWSPVSSSFPDFQIPIILLGIHLHRQCPFPSPVFLHNSESLSDFSWWFIRHASFFEDMPSGRNRHTMMACLFHVVSVCYISLYDFQSGKTTSFAANKKRPYYTISYSTAA